jgi:glycosyltransferase involved in cell wall biosynthesis
LGGASFALSDILEQLIAGGCKVWILTPLGPVADRFSNQGATTVFWEPPAVYWLGCSTFSSGKLRVSVGYLLDIVRTPWRIVNAIKNITTLIRAHQIDTIYVNTMVLFPLGYMLALIKRKYNIKVIWHVRELLNPRLSCWVSHWILNSISGVADIVLSISKATALPFVGKCTPVLDGNKVGREWIDSCNEHRPVLTSKTKHIVMVTSFLSGKGIPDFLHLAREIHKINPKIKFTLYTSCPVLATRGERCLASMLTRWGESARILVDLWNCHSSLVIDGYLSVIFDHHLVPKDLSKVSILVNPDSSGVTWGRVVIEAMCTGVPTISYGTNQEYIKEGITGYLVKPGDFNELLRRVQELLTDSYKARKMGECAQASITQIYQAVGTVITQSFGIESCKSTMLSHSVATHEKQDNRSAT